DRNRHLHQDLGRIDLARVEWFEGRIAKELGHHAEAKKALHGVREFFLDLQLGAEVVLVSLNLAELYSLNGEHRQTREVLNETIPLGEALGLSQEVFLARLLYAKASQH